MEVLEHIGMGILGILLYNAFAFRKHFKHVYTKVFWASYWDKSKVKLVWSILMILLVSGIVYISPESANSIKELTGLDIANSLPAYLTFGLGVSSLADTETK